MIDLATWKHSSEPYAGKHQVLTVITCPACKREFILSGKIHKVMANGTVTPSLVCPLDDCSFHEFVKLANWTPPDWFLTHTMESFVEDVRDNQ